MPKVLHERPTGEDEEGDELENVSLPASIPAARVQSVFLISPAIKGKKRVCGKVK